MGPDEIMKKWQELLIKRGFPVGPDGADGYGGHSTQEAILAFQKANKLDETGKFDEVTQKKLTEKQYVDLKPFLPILLSIITKGNFQMNKDQFINLVQTLVNIGVASAGTWGILDQNTWVTVGAAVVAVATYVYTHYWNKTTI